MASEHGRRRQIGSVKLMERLSWYQLSVNCESLSNFMRWLKLIGSLRPF